MMMMMMAATATWRMMRRSLAVLLQMAGFVLIFALFLLTLWTRQFVLRQARAANDMQQQIIVLIGDQSAQIMSLQKRVELLEADIERSTAPTPPRTTVTRFEPVSARIVGDLRERIERLEHWRLTQLGR